MTQIKLIMAGPGAGKTENLVDSVLKNLPTLEAHRFIAVITYTNAATQRIQMKLEERSQMPFNLFVGTIHSFLNKFILIPYSHVFALTPSDLKFVEDLIIAERERKYKNMIIKRARDKGVIPYAQIEQISKKLVLGGKLKAAESEVTISRPMAKRIASVIAHRLKFIFVDEYQDATVDQHEIFEGLIAANHIKEFYCVGDAEQYIYTFRYKEKAGTPPTFNEIPIKLLGSSDDIEKETIPLNRRSTGAITNFINSFATVQQTLPVSGENDAPVIFLEGTNLPEVVEKFEQTRTEYQLNENESFYLSYSPKEVHWHEIPQISELSSIGVEPSEIVKEAIRYICSSLGRSTSVLCNELNISEVDLRMAAIEIIRMVNTDSDINQERIDAYLNEKFGIEIVNSHKRDESLRHLRSFAGRTQSDSNRKYSSIHKSKGLEAESVLVIAKTLNQLKKWIETDRDTRAADSLDQCRLGFVAFSRAKKLLCVGCLEDLDENTKEKLRNFHVVTR